MAAALTGVRLTALADTSGSMTLWGYGPGENVGFAMLEAISWATEHIDFDPELLGRPRLPSRKLGVSNTWSSSDLAILSKTASGQ